VRGHIAKKNKRYYVVLEEGIDARTGRRHRTYHAAGTSLRAAERLLAERLEQKRTDTYVQPAQLLLGDYLVNEWLPSTEHQVRPSTFDAYRRTIELHIQPRIGRLKLQKLRPIDLTKFYADLLRNGRRDSKGGLSAKTVHNVHQILRKALEDAVRQNYLVRNAAASAKVPSPKAARRNEMQYWTADELRQFLHDARDSRHFPAWYLAANTGMRRGEVLGLRWRDLDLRAGRVAVRRALVSVAYELHESDTKTHRGERLIDLDARTIGVLVEHRVDQRAERKLVSDGYKDLGLVFARPDGSPIHPDLFSKAFDRQVASARVPRIRLHDLRHTHATLLLQAGVPPKVVSERLGHATVAFTMQVYAHVMPGMQADAAKAFGELVFPDEENPDRHTDHRDAE
jgi:integrase